MKCRPTLVGLCRPTKGCFNLLQSVCAKKLINALTLHLYRRIRPKVVDLSFIHSEHLYSADPNMAC